MARYKVLETSFIGDKLVEPFDADGKPNIIEYAGTPGANLQLVGADVKTVGVEANGGVYTHDASDLA